MRAERRFSVHSQEAYARDLSKFFDFLVAYESRGIDLDYLAAVDRRALRSWLAQLRTDGLGAASSARALSAVKSFYDFARKRVGLENAQVVTQRGPKRGESCPRP